MKKKVILSIICVAFLLGACGISKSDYEAAISERDSLQEQLNILKTENENLQEKNQKLSSTVSTLQKEQLKLIEEQSDFIETQAWIMAAFGDNSIILKSDKKDYLEVIASDNYELSQEGIKQIWDSSRISTAVLEGYKDKIPYEKIAVKFLDTNKEEMIEFILKRNNNNYELAGINGDLLRSDIIVPYILKLLE